MQLLLVSLASLLIVGFGQPAFSSWASLAAATVGYALFFWVLLSYESRRHRFWIGTAWFTAVQLIQLSWFISHPYLYIIAVYMTIAFIMGLQFGLLSLWIRPAQLQKPLSLLAIAGLWSLIEWSRLFVLSGFSWNPSGLALSAHLYPLQAASLVGIYGLSFWVILVNLLALRAWLQRPNILPWITWGYCAILPFLYGAWHINWHQEAFANETKDPSKAFSALLVQTAFPIEETIGLKDQRQMIAYVLDEWRKILSITKSQIGKPVDLVVLPEFTVPYGTYSYVFPYPIVVSAFQHIYGPAVLEHLPSPEAPLGKQLKTLDGDVWMVSNAFWSQSLANIFNAEVIVGLEDAEEVRQGSRLYYSAAMHFQPQPEYFTVNRYEKRVLVPMGEYIPFAFCQKLAEAYGICGSFTPGIQAKVFGNKKRMGLSICYEETFGHLMRENKVKGAELLVNLTSDVWYPHSKLTQQHFDHARLRTVENGLPLLRACNTGITGAVDSLGRVVKVLGDNPEQGEWLADSLRVEVPTYTYSTLYGRLGDTLIVCISAVFVLLGLRFRD